MVILEMCSARWYNADAQYSIGFASEMAKKGHRVFFLSFKNSPPEIKAKELGLPCVPNVNFNSLNPFVLAVSILFFILFVAKNKIEIINAHRSPDHFFAACCYPFFFRKIKLIRTRGDIRAIKKTPLSKWLYRHAAAQHVVAANFYLSRNDYTSLGIPREKITVIYPAIKDIRSALSKESARQKLNLPPNKPVLLFVGRFVEIKGIPILIKACQQINQRVHVHLILLGREHTYSKEQIESLEGFNKDWITLINNERQIGEIIAAADLGIIPSTGSEAIGRVCLEMMACELPVIGTSVGVLPELINPGKTGILVPPASASAITEAVIELLKNKALMNSMGAAARKLYEDSFTLKKFAEQVETVYKKTF